MMRTELTDAGFRALLMPVTSFPHVDGVEQERTLILTGRLTPVTVGRTLYYLRADVDTLTGGAK